MKTLFQHIDHVKGKPHHIRKKVAFGAAGALSGLVALVWLTSSLATGAFAIQGSNFAQSVADGAHVESVNKTPAQGLAAAASALLGADAPPPHIEIVTVVATSTPAHQGEETTIPF